MWVIAVGAAWALSCDSGADTWDPYGPEACEVIAVTPAHGEAAVADGVLAVTTTDGCGELALWIGGVEVLALERLVETDTPTAHRQTVRFPLSGLPAGEAVVYVRQRRDQAWNEGELTLRLGAGVAGEVSGEAAVGWVETMASDYCDTGCCSDAWSQQDATVSWTRPAATAPGWTARLLDASDRYVDERPLSGAPFTSETVVEGPVGSASPCFRVATFDPFGVEQLRTDCVSPEKPRASRCGCATGPGSSHLLAGLALAVLAAASRARVR